MARTNGNENGSSPRTRSKSTKKKLSTHEQIELRAYEIYLQRNGTPGDPLADWVRCYSLVGVKKSTRSRQ
jgi:Protein of unknown function (DUF2934)